MTSIKDGRGTQKSRQQQRKERGSGLQSQRPVPSSGPSSPRPVKKVDLDECPAGYDPDVWSLTLLFRQEAAREGIDLVEFSNILLYAKLEKAVAPFRSWFAKRPEGARPIRIPDGPAPRFREAKTWAEVVEAVIRYRFAEYVEDAYAADRFCQEGTFRDMVKETRERGYHRYLKTKAEELPDREPARPEPKKFRPWDGKGQRPRRLEEEK